MTVKNFLEEHGVLSKDEVAKQRIALCHACPELKIKAGLEICGKCGCILDIKRLIFRARCPLGNW